MGHPKRVTYSLFGVKAHENSDPHESFLDLGTGSGVILLWLGTRTTGQLFGLDNFPLAIANARTNLEAYGFLDDRVQLIESDALKNFPHRVDVVVANFAIPQIPSPTGLTPAGEPEEDNPNLVDFNGAALKSIFGDLPQVLTPRGRMYLLSRHDLSDYIPKFLTSRVLRTFPENLPVKKRVTIHEVRVR